MIALVVGLRADDVAHRPWHWVVLKSMRLNLCLCLQTAKEIHAVGDEVEDEIFLHGIVHNVVQHGADVIDGELHPPVDSIAQTVLHRTSHVAEIDPLITVRNGGGADIDRARGDDGGDHYQQ